ncbi:MAG: VWA domain-containing protein [Phycisphaerales bacterium]|nr:VWA domain-containing protein [Phycisphaerales bacterium]
MRYIYQEWDGREFETQAHLKQFEHFLDFVIEHGADALEALKELELDDEQRAILEQWIADGLLERVGARFELTPRAINSLQRKALMEVFRNLHPDSAEGHESERIGRGGDPSEGSRPYAFGDPVSELDMHQTLRNAIGRRGVGSPIRMDESDFEVRLSESRATCSTVILLDMSGSMSRWQRFASAKRCAMALFALIRQRFALDTVDVVGFHSAAEIIPEHKLALAMPKPISSGAPQIRMRVPIDRIQDAPQHFTNLHMGLMTARKILARRGGRNRQVFIITDGQPTAHVQDGMIHLIYPPSEPSVMATLGEALQLARRGIRFSTFALIEDYFYMDWVGFVDQLTRLTRGVAFYCTGSDLASAIMESYMTGRKRRTHPA